MIMTVSEGRSNDLAYLSRYGGAQLGGDRLELHDLDCWVEVDDLTVATTVTTPAHGRA